MNDALQKACARLGLAKWEAPGEQLTVRSPIDGSTMATVPVASSHEVEQTIDSASAAFLKWRIVPAPARGQFVRTFGEVLRAHKDDLATIVSWEAGKITQEALGEVQEM